MSALVLVIVATSSVNSLLLPASPVGLSTSFATADHGEALFYNPAKFEAGDSYSLWCSYNRFYLGMQSVSLAISKRIQPITLGIAFLNFDYGEIEQRPNYPTEDPITYYSAHDFSLILGGSAAISEQGRVGVNLKYITESIHIHSGYAFALDISFSYSSQRTGLSFGASNIGTKITILNEQENLPTYISIGGFYDFLKFQLSADARYLVNTASLDETKAYEFAVGARIPLYEILSVHATLLYRESFYPGFGIDVQPGIFRIKYSGSLYPKNLGMVNTIGIGFDF